MKSCLLFFALAFIAMLGGSEAYLPNPCSVFMMHGAYNEMVRVQCMNCDKYFHCIGNYNAVHRCTGPYRESTAEVLGKARELFGGRSGSGDSEADKEANRFGRSGGSCVERYLRKQSCAYNPVNRLCKW